jgi:hypothetical protein
VHHLLPDIYIVEEKLWIRRGQKGLRRITAVCVCARREKRGFFFQLSTPLTV